MLLDGTPVCPCWAHPEAFASRPSLQGWPGGPVVKDPPANAGDTGFNPWPRRTPPAAEQLSRAHDSC